MNFGIHNDSNNSSSYSNSCIHCNKFQSCYFSHLFFYNQSLSSSYFFKFYLVRFSSFSLFYFIFRYFDLYFLFYPYKRCFTISLLRSYIYCSILFTLDFKLGKILLFYLLSSTLYGNNFRGVISKKLALLIYLSSLLMISLMALHTSTPFSQVSATMHTRCVC